jgi:hypothetical protein
MFVLSSIVIGFQYQSLGQAGDTTYEAAADTQQQVGPPSENITVVVSDATPDARRSALVAIASNGSVLYYNETYSNYQDVDPVPGTKTTVSYLAAEHISEENCPSNAQCSRMVLEKLNLTTGEATQLYSQMVFARDNDLGERGNAEWHDGDRINETHYLIGDIALDRVFVINISSGITTYEWKAISHYPLSAGHDHPGDWTHINDVTVVNDTTYMVSVRNMDEVLFIGPSGVREDMTLGETNDHSILYEQHNPDYIPAEHGGPAVLVADSENNRIIEYQQTEDEWKQSWVWTDGRLSWPRDADRLPNGNTLISDSLSNRVVEVDEEGETVWEISIFNPYEAERLGTGEESQDGPSASRADLTSREGKADTAEQNSPDPVRVIINVVRDLLPPQVLHGIVFILPPWLNGIGYFAVAGVILPIGGLVSIEFYTRVYQKVETQWPIKIT